MMLVLFLFSSLDNISAFLSIEFNTEFSTISFILIIPLFFLLRFSGQGVLTMVSRNMVMKWFDKNRGKAAAIMGVITTFGFSYAPGLLNSIIIGSSWKQTYRYIAIGAGIIFAGIALVLFRDNPSQCGLKIDGKNIKAKEEKIKPEIKNITLKEARKTAVFWIFNLSLTIHALLNTALTFHIVSFFESAGMNNEAAFSIFLPVSVISVFFRFLGSWISDFIKLKYILIVQLAGMLITCIASIFLAPGLSVIFLVIGLGISGGLFGVLNSITWISFYGPGHLGAISGFSMGCLVAGSAVGPYMFSLSEKIAPALSQ